MEAIARATFIREEYPLVMGIVWERISSKKWRNVYKALDLLKYLCLHGSQRCCDEARDAVPHMQALVHFRYVDTAGKDEGRNVRERAKQLLELLQSPEMMREERERSKALRAKIGDGSGKVAAVSSDDYRYGGGPSASQSHYGGGGGAEQDFHDREYGGGTDADYTSAGYQGGAYGEYDYGEHVDQNGESSNVNTGLDDLLGLSDAPYGKHARTQTLPNCILPQSFSPTALARLAVVACCVSWCSEEGSFLTLWLPRFFLPFGPRPWWIRECVCRSS